MRFAAIVVAVTCAVPPLARAELAPPQPYLAPSSGASLPPTPTVYGFVPGNGPGLFTANGVPVAAERVGEDRGFSVYRLTLPVLVGDVTVAYADPSHPVIEHAFSDGRYHVGATTSMHRAKVTGVFHYAQRHTCFSANYIRVATKGDAIALRFDWHGREESTLISADSVLSSDLPMTDFDLVALFADGTEERIGASRLQLHSDSFRLPVELVPERHLDGAIEPVIYAPELTAEQLAHLVALTAELEAKERSRQFLEKLGICANEPTDAFPPWPLGLLALVLAAAVARFGAHAPVLDRRR